MQTLERIATALERIAAAMESGGLAQPAAVTGQGQPTFCGFAAAWSLDALGYPAYIVDGETGEIVHKHQKQGDTWYSVKDESAAGGYRQLLRIGAGETLPASAKWRAPDAQAPAAVDDATARNAAAPVHQNGAQAHQQTDEGRAQEAQTAAERAPEPTDTAPAEPLPQSTAADADNPFDGPSDHDLQQLHAAGRAVYGEAWRVMGPQQILAWTDGRCDTSRGMTLEEVALAIADLTDQIPAARRRAGGAAYAG